MNVKYDMFFVSPENVENKVWGGVNFLRFLSCVPGEVLVIKELQKQRMVRI